MIPPVRSIRAVAFDLDDTLLRDDLSISDQTVQTLRHLAGSGIHVIPASGRTRMSMQPFVDRLSCAALFIASNGAEIREGSTGRLLHQETFSTEIGQEIARFGKDHHCYTQTYDGDRFYFNERSVWADQYAAASVLSGVYVGDLEAFIREPRTKILIMDTPDRISVLLREAREQFRGRVSVTCSKPWFLEFNALRATKGIAIGLAASRLGFSAENVMAFGDSLNDLPMLRAAGWSVAVANAREEVRSECDSVCLSNQQDGVALFLRQAFREVCF